MEIVFDQPKRLTNIAKHGYDFASLSLEFFLAATVLDGEQGRFVAIGEHDGKVIAVVFAPLGTQGISIVSMRRASRKERAIHDQS